MPAAPEINDVDGLVRGIEIDRQLDAEHKAQANGHVAVAREIKIDLKGVGQRGHPGVQHVHKIPVRNRVEHWICKHAQVIRQRGLLEQPYRKNCHAPVKVIKGHADQHRAELGDEIVVVHNWPGDELRKKGHE